MALVVVGVGALSGCVEKNDAPTPEPALVQETRAIINGQADTAHPAAVAVFGDQSVCSGTIVQTDPASGVGWVLTAAHCVDSAPRVVIEGRDYDSFNSVQYGVIDWVDHPAYDPNGSTEFDFAVIRISGVDGATPVIPVVGSSDGLSRNSPVTSVGYGRTTRGQGPDSNTVRRTVDRTLSGVSTQLIWYSIADAGICQGDSGGPVLTGSGAATRVVGVHSSVTGDCDGEGFSGRVTGVYDTWLEGVLAGDVEESCELCRQVAQSGNGGCIGSIDACFDNNGCNAFAACLNGCNTDACSEGCVEDASRATLDLYFGISECICEDVCAAICAGDESCPEPPACGVVFADEACNTCQESACCATAQACDDDGVCLDCLNGEGEGCENNSAFDAYVECLSDSCGEACGLTSACGLTGEGACGTCIEGACCDETTACAEDQSCLDCVTGEGDCVASPQLDNFLDCLYECDDNPCGVPDPEGNNDPANNDPANNDPANNDPANNDPVNNGNNDPANNDPANNDPANNDPANNGNNDPGNNDPTNNGTNGNNDNNGNNGGGFLDLPDDNNNMNDNPGGDRDQDEDEDSGGGARRSCSTAVPASAPESFGPLGIVSLLALGLLAIRRR